MNKNKYNFQNLNTENFEISSQDTDNKDTTKSDRLRNDIIVFFLIIMLIVFGVKVVQSNIEFNKQIERLEVERWKHTKGLIKI